MNELELTHILLGNKVTAPYFCGVISYDELYHKVPQTGFYICNTDASTGPGEHWVALAWFHGVPAEFFDSLARPPSDYNTDFIDFLILNGPNYKYSSKRIQDHESVKCGEFCIFYAYHRCSGYSLESILNMFTDNNLKRNDIKVESFVNSL